MVNGYEEFKMEIGDSDTDKYPHRIGNISRSIKLHDMRTVTLIIVHCSAVKPDQQSSAAQIDTWHRQRGFHLGIGYHYVIRRDGTREMGRPEYMVGAHCQGHNKYSIGVCYEGGLDNDGRPADTRTEAQRQALRQLLLELKQRYPRALIVGHHDLNPMKACPCFDAAEYRSL